MTAVAVFTILNVYSFVRLDDAFDTLQDHVSLIETLEERETRLEQAEALEEEGETLDACRRRNTANAEYRESETAAHDVLEFDLGVNSDAVSKLRAALPTAAEQDRDCDGDQLLTGADYAPPPEPAATGGG
jgi:hypothetical protein